MFRYNIIFSRRRTMAISVSPDKGVTVRAPLRTSLKTIEKFVASRSDWVLKHLENFEKNTRLNPKISDGKNIHFRGKEYSLKLVDSQIISVTIDGNEICVAGPIVKIPTSPEKILKIWYYNQASRIITQKVQEVLAKYAVYQFNPSMLTIRTMKRRWGSCSSKGRITINSELIKIDDIFTEYVILHELCHLKHHNHGTGFYKLLSEVFPDWKNVRKDLRKYLS